MNQRTNFKSFGFDSRSQVRWRFEVPTYTFTFCLINDDIVARIAPAKGVPCKCAYYMIYRNQ